MKNLTIFIITAIFSTVCFAEERLSVLVPAILPDTTLIAEAVKKECSVPEKIGESIYEEIKKSNKNVEKVSVPVNGRLVQATLLSVYGAGGGAWSGSKVISIKLDFLKDGQVVKSTVLQRGSNGGVFGGFNGTCKIMERIEKALGKDAAKWLKSNAS